MDSYSYTYTHMHDGDQILKFVQLMMSKFLPISALRDKLSEVDYKSRTIQLQGKSLTQIITIKILFAHADDRLQIGFVTQQQANALLEEGDIDPGQLANGVRAFFERAVDYSLKSLPPPLHDQLLQAATFNSFDQRATADSLHAEYFINRL